MPVFRGLRPQNGQLRTRARIASSLACSSILGACSHPLGLLCMLPPSVASWSHAGDDGSSFDTAYDKCTSGPGPKYLGLRKSPSPGGGDNRPAYTNDIRTRFSLEHPPSWNLAIRCNGTFPPPRIREMASAAPQQEISVVSLARQAISEGKGWGGNPTRRSHSPPSISCAELSALPGGIVMLQRCSKVQLAHSSNAEDGCRHQGPRAREEILRQIPLRWCV
jgi:hypothetical protein